MTINGNTLTINRNTYLKELRCSAWNDVFGYSKNYLMSEAKDGMQEKFELAIAKANILDQIVDEIPVVHEDESLGTKRYTRKIIGKITGWRISDCYGTGASVDTVDVDILNTGNSHLDSDTRIFRIDVSLGRNYIISGKYDEEHRFRLLDGKSGVVCITVETGEYITDISWLDA